MSEELTEQIVWHKGPIPQHVCESDFKHRVLIRNVDGTIVEIHAWNRMGMDENYTHWAEAPKGPNMPRRPERQEIEWRFDLPKTGWLHIQEAAQPDKILLRVVAKGYATKFVNDQYIHESDRAYAIVPVPTFED